MAPFPCIDTNTNPPVPSGEARKLDFQRAELLFVFAVVWTFRCFSIGGSLVGEERRKGKAAKQS